MLTEAPPNPEAPLVHANVVKFIEDLLEQAKKGEIRSVAIVTEWSNGETSNSWAMGRYHRTMAIMGETFHMATQMATRGDPE